MSEKLGQTPVSDTGTIKATGGSEGESNEGAGARGGRGGGAGTPNGAAAATEIPKWLVPAAFIIGVVFLSVILALVVFIPTPTPAQFQVFKIIIALGGAAFAMAITGFLAIHLPVGGGGYIVGGGALAVFLILFFFSPAAKLVTEPKPKIGLLKNAKIFVATDKNRTLPMLLKKVGGIALDSEDQLSENELAKYLPLFEIERPRELDDLLHAIREDTLASDETKQHVRDWEHDERSIRIQVLRILASFGKRELSGSGEYYTYMTNVGEQLKTQTMVVSGGDDALKALEIQLNRPDPPGQDTDDVIVTCALRYISAATTILYSRVMYFPAKYFEGVDEAFRAYITSALSDRNEIVKTVGYSDCASEPFIELETGKKVQYYSRIWVPLKKIDSRAAKKHFLEHPFNPLGPPKGYFCETWWVQNATWQMLAREHGQWLEHLPVRLEKFDVIGIP
jgi:hypothetical protein